VQQLINGFSTGAVYALIALGYSLVFSVMRMINLAHCDIMMVGAYTGYLCAVYLNAGFIVSCIISVIVCSLLGIIIERSVYFKIHDTSIYLMVASIGVSLLIEYIFMLIFGADARVYPPNFMGGLITGNINIPVSRFITLIITLILTVLLQLLLLKTKYGMAMRAVADDKIAAELCGVDEKSTISFAFCLGSSLAGIAGVIYGSMYLINPMMGTVIGIKAFVAAVIGGIGNLSGAVLGGFVLGLAETLTGSVLSTAFKDVGAYIILIFILLIKPGGLTNSKFGKARL
jgi:branched-chain amino acid transport system permease protein